MNTAALKDVLDSKEDKSDDESLVTILKYQFPSDESTDEYLRLILKDIFLPIGLRNFEIHRRMIIFISIIVCSLLKNNKTASRWYTSNKLNIFLPCPLNILFRIDASNTMFESKSKKTISGLKEKYEQLKNEIDKCGIKKYCLKEWERMRRLIAFYGDLFVQLSINNIKKEFPYHLKEDDQGNTHICFSLNDCKSKSGAFTKWIQDINSIASELLCKNDPSFTTCVDYKKHFNGILEFIKLGGKTEKNHHHSLDEHSIDASSRVDVDVDDDDDDSSSSDNDNSRKKDESLSSIYLLIVKKVWSYLISSSSSSLSSTSLPSQSIVTVQHCKNKRKIKEINIDDDQSNKIARVDNGSTVNDTSGIDFSDYGCILDNNSDDPDDPDESDNITHPTDSYSDIPIADNDSITDTDDMIHVPLSVNINGVQDIVPANGGAGNDEQGKAIDPNADKDSDNPIIDEFKMIPHAYGPILDKIEGVEELVAANAGAGNDEQGKANIKKTVLKLMQTNWATTRRNTVVITTMDSIEKAMESAADAVVNCFDDKICSLDINNKMCYLKRKEQYGKLKIIQHTIKDLNKVYLGDVITVNGWFMDSILLEQITEELNDIPMHEYGVIMKYEIKERFKRFFGYYSNKNCTAYGYKNDAILIKALPMPPLLQIVVDIMNQTLLEPVYKMLKSKNVHVFNHKMEDIQVMFTKDGTGFGPHSDASITTCIYPDQKCYDHKIPFVSEMVVTTMVLVIDKYNKIVADDEKLSTELSYLDDQGNTLKKIEMKGILFHAQYMNLQKTSKHKISCTSKYWESGWRRLVFSARQTSEGSNVIQDNQIKKYKNCLAGMLEEKSLIEIENNTLHKYEQKIDAITKYKNKSNSKMVIDYVRSSVLCTDSLSMLLIERPALFVKCDLDWLRSIECYMLLIEAGKALRVTSNNNLQSISYFNGGYAIGCHYNSSTIRNYYDLSGGEGRSVTGVYHRKFEHLKVLALHTQCRNNMDLNYAARVFLEKEKNDGNVNNVINKFSGYEKVGEKFLQVGPRGGSYSNPSAFSNNDNAGSCVRNTANASKACPELQNAVLKSTVLNLFIPLDWVFDHIDRPKTKESSNRLLYVGPVVGSAYTMLDPDKEEDPDNETNTPLNDFTKKHLQNGSWSSTRNMVADFWPVFNSTNQINGKITKNISRMNDVTNDFIYNFEPIVKQIPRDDLDISKEESIKDRAPKKVAEEWLSQEIKSDIDLIEQTIELSDISNQNKYTTIEAISQMINNTVGSFCRVLDISSTDKGLAYIPIKSLSMVNGMYGITSCIRTYNIPLFLIVSNILEPAEKANHYTRMERDTIKNHESLVYILLALIIVRTTGRPILFSLFSDFLERNKHDCPLQTKNVHSIIHKFELPYTKEKFVLFLEFLEEISDEESTIKTYVSVLYEGCLLSCSNGTIHGYRLFLLDACTALLQWIREETFRNIFVGNGMQYPSCVTSLRDILLTHGNNGEIGTTRDQKEKHLFLAALIIADLDELYIDAINQTAEPLSVYGGPYLKYGLNFFYSVKSTSKSETNKRLHEIHMRFTKSLLELSKPVLAAMGLEKNGNKLLVSINKRPFSPIDTEHILCKLVIPTRLTGCGYLGTSQIKLHFRHYEYPLGLKTEQLNVFSEVAKRSLVSFFHEDTIKAISTVSKNTRFPISEQWCEDKSWNNAVIQLLKTFPKHPIFDLFKQLGLSEHLECIEEKKREGSQTP